MYNQDDTHSTKQKHCYSDYNTIFTNTTVTTVYCSATLIWNFFWNTASHYFQPECLKCTSTAKRCDLPTTSWPRSWRCPEQGGGEFFTFLFHYSNLLNPTYTQNMPPKYTTATTTTTRRTTTTTTTTTNNNNNNNNNNTTTTIFMTTTETTTTTTTPTTLITTTTSTSTTNRQYNNIQLYYYHCHYHCHCLYDHV